VRLCGRRLEFLHPSLRVLAESSLGVDSKRELQAMHGVLKRLKYNLKVTRSMGRMKYSFQASSLDKSFKTIFSDLRTSLSGIMEREAHNLRKSVNPRNGMDDSSRLLFRQKSSSSSSIL
jgi:hypothetical protein